MIARCPFIGFEIATRYPRLTFRLKTQKEASKPEGLLPPRGRLLVTKPKEGLPLDGLYHDYGRLTDFRKSLYGCFTRARDALMNTCDALLTQIHARSFPEPSLSPFFARAAQPLRGFDDARIDQQALHKLFVTAIPQTRPGKRLVLAADASPIVRPESPTARDRTYVHVPNLPKEAKPVLPGWHFATIAALPEQPSSWTTILSNRRIKSEQTVGQVVAQQLSELAPLLPKGTLVALDGGFGNVTFVSLVHKIPLGKLLRIAKNRTLYRAAPPKTGKRGRPRKEGALFVLGDPSTHGTPDEQCSGADEQSQALEVTCWHDLHFKSRRDALLSLLRITAPGRGPVKARSGRALADLARCRHAAFVSDPEPVSSSLLY